MKLKLILEDKRHEAMLHRLPSKLYRGTHSKAGLTSEDEDNGVVWMTPLKEHAIQFAYINTLRYGAPASHRKAVTSGKIFPVLIEIDTSKLVNPRRASADDAPPEDGLNFASAWAWQVDVLRPSAVIAKRSLANDIQWQHDLARAIDTDFDDIQ